MSDRHRSDSDLIRESLRDPVAFEELFVRHFDSIHRFLVVRVGRDDADELASEVFVRAFAARHRFRQEFSSARPWLFGIALNLVRQRARSLRRRAVALQRLFSRDATTAEPADVGVDRAAAQLEWPRLAVALSHLSSDERNVVGLHLVADLTQTETAEALGIPLGTVKTRLARARRKLEELLDTDRQTSPVEGTESGGQGE